MKFLSFALVALVFVSSLSAELRITQFASGDLEEGIFVNVFVIDDGTTAMVMEGARDNLTAPIVREFIENEGLTVELMWVSHGHPDHWFGIPVMAGYWPDAVVQVASENIKQELIGFRNAVEGFGILPAYAASYDFETNLQVLEGNTISLFGSDNLLQVQVYDIAGESSYTSTLYQPESRTLLAADLLYNKVMLYLGFGVTLESAQNWRKILLPSLLAQYPNTAIVYPGHGPSSTDLAGAIDDAQEFILTFERLLLSCDDDYNHPSIDEIVDTMRNEYSTWNQGLWIDPVLSPVGNPAWIEAQQDGICIYPDSDRSAGSQVVVTGLVCLVAAVFGLNGL